MSKSSIRNYRFGQKNNWRRTEWNDIVQRVRYSHGRDNDLPILYLPGPSDIDRSIAIAKGVHPLNLIAIDRYLDNVDAVRSNGNLAINADVVAVIHNWPCRVHMAAVSLDLCCGLEKQVMHDVFHGLWRGPFRNTVVAVNFQRGRDASTNYIREAIDLCQSKSSVTLDHLFTKNGARFIGPSKTNKNRALQLLAFCVFSFMNIENEQVWRYLARLNNGLLDTDGVRVHVFSQLIMSMSPTFISYTSDSGIVFDSVVYNNLHPIDVVYLWTGKYVHRPSSSDDDELVGAGAIRTDISVRRRIAATLAIRTRRMHAAGP